MLRERLWSADVKTRTPTTMTTEDGPAILAEGEVPQCSLCEETRCTLFNVKRKSC